MMLGVGDGWFNGFVFVFPVCVSVKEGMLHVGFLLCH